MRIRARRVTTTVVALALLSLVAAAAAGPATALPPDVIDPPELPGGEPFVAPENGFVWSLPANFGPLHNGLVDYRWNEAAGSRYAGPAYTYDPAYVRPIARTAFFDGCPTQAEADAGDSTTYVYTWSVHLPGSGAGVGAPVSRTNCQWSRTFVLDPHTGESVPHQVRLAITTPAGDPYPGYPAGKSFDEQTVHVRDLLIVSLGDSYGSGEGAPDVPQVIDALGFVATEARWVDKRCHRSAFAPSAVAARQLEAADPHTTVTFLSFACSGATISTPYFHDQAKLDPYKPAPAGGFREPVGTGILGPYRGIEPPDPDDWTPAGMLPSQVDQLRYALTNGHVAPPRRVDALSVSGGGNDMGFGPVALVCTLYYECDDHFVTDANLGGEVRLSHRFAQSVATMPARYQALAAALEPLPITRTYITQYPDPSSGDGGGRCARILDDVIPGWMAPLLAAAALLESDPAPLPPYQLDGGHLPDGGEVGWAGGAVLSGINGAVGAAAAAQGWTLVDGIADSGANLFAGHGYCATGNWIRTASESVAMQGPWDPPALCNLALLTLAAPLFLANCAPPATTRTTGTLHPTARGYQAIAGRLIARMRPDLLPPPPAGPAVAPTIADVRTAAVAGADGWLTGAAPGHTCAGGGASCVPVRLSATVPGPTSLQGVALSVNGSPLSCSPTGVTTGGVTCAAELADPHTHVWSLSFGADGIYQLEATATARNGTRTDVPVQVKVDLGDPTSAVATPSSAEPPTVGWYRTPVEVRLSGADAPGGSGIGTVEYQLDGGPVQVVPDGAVIRLDTDGTHTFSLRPVDRAGRRGPVQPPVSVRIDQTPPAVACGAADGQWHAADVTIGCTASDATSGLASADDASFALSTSVPAGSETADATTGDHPVCDVAGNCAGAGPVSGNRVDRKGPQVDISAPGVGRLLVNQVVAAAYGCSDGGSGVASCSGPVPPGAPVDTSEPGSRDFTVVAADHAGNVSHATVGYTVGYGVCLHYDPSVAQKAGGTVPIRLAVCDATGANLSSADVVLTAVAVVHTGTGRSVPVQAPGNSQPGNRFRFEDGAYSFNLKTTGYAPGDYELRFTISGDAAVYAAPLVVR